MSEPKEFYEDDLQRAYEEGMAAGAREQWEKAQEDAREREASQEEWSNPISEPEGPFVEDCPMPVDPKELREWGKPNVFNAATNPWWVRDPYRVAEPSPWHWAVRLGQRAIAYCDDENNAEIVAASLRAHLNSGLTSSERETVAKVAEEIRSSEIAHGAYGKTPSENALSYRNGKTVVICSLLGCLEHWAAALAPIAEEKQPK